MTRLRYALAATGLVLCATSIALSDLDGEPAALVDLPVEQPEERREQAGSASSLFGTLATAFDTLRGARDTAPPRYGTEAMEAAATAEERQAQGAATKSASRSYEVGLAPSDDSNRESGPADEDSSATIGNLVLSGVRVVVERDRMDGSIRIRKEAEKK